MEKGIRLWVRPMSSTITEYRHNLTGAGAPAAMLAMDGRIKISILLPGRMLIVWFVTTVLEPIESSRLLVEIRSMRIRSLGVKF